MTPVDCLYLSEMTDVDLFWKHALGFRYCKGVSTDQPGSLQLLHLGAVIYSCCTAVVAAGMKWLVLSVLDLSVCIHPLKVIRN